ncbi:MAG: sigma 54-interacting transcriptional regulator [Verrucomicrobiota bacterium]
MALKRVLVSWIGHTDLWAMAAAQPDEAARASLLQLIQKETRKPPPNLSTVGDGPVKTLLSQRTFDEIHLLTQYSEEVNQLFAAWIHLLPQFHVYGREVLPDPSDYVRVFQISHGLLKSIQKDAQLFILLSPGTPTMAAVWIVLGRTVSATLLQTYRGQVNEAIIPFEVTVDVLPQYDPDVRLRQLTTSPPHEIAGFEKVVGSSARFLAVVARAKLAAIRDVPVLLTGESGTGKEVIAEAMHRASHRGRGPKFSRFVACNCAAVPDALFESELFGHVKGAFTDAKEDKKGAFERAHGGTLFLDEVGELSPQNQAKLLRALQSVPDGGFCDFVICPVGADREIRCNARIIAATNRNLFQAINAGTFRDDLYYRLAPIQIELPPLRQRRSDIVLLTKDIIARINAEFSKTKGYLSKRLSADAMRPLHKHPWPGNIRELSNVLIQAAVFSSSDEITSDDIHAAITTLNLPETSMLSRTEGERIDLDARLESIERRFIEDALRETEQNQTKAGALLGWSQQQLRLKAKKYHLL